MLSRTIRDFRTRELQIGRGGLWTGKRAYRAMEWYQKNHVETGKPLELVPGEVDMKEAAVSANVQSAKSHQRYSL